MNEENQRLALAFIRIVANHCDDCYRRNSANCASCVALRAKRLISKINSENPVAVDYSVLARKRQILAALKALGRPAEATEIKISIPCSAQLKRWTLNRMAKEHLICRTLKRIVKPSGYKIYSYFLPQTKGYNP